MKLILSPASLNLLLMMRKIRSLIVNTEVVENENEKLQKTKRKKILKVGWPAQHSHGDGLTVKMITCTHNVRFSIYSIFETQPWKTSKIKWMISIWPPIKRERHLRIRLKQLLGLKKVPKYLVLNGSKNFRGAFGSAK